MKKLFSFILLIGLFTTVNAQADEIINHADMFALSIVELSELETPYHAIEQNNDNERFNVYEFGDSRYTISLAESGQHESIYANIPIEGTTNPYIKKGCSDLIITAEWEPITSLVPLRLFGSGSTNFEGNDNPPEGNDRTLRGDSADSRERETYRLACTCKVDHWRSNRT